MTLSCVIPSVLIATSFQHRLLRSSDKFIAINSHSHGLNIWILKKRFRNVNLSNLENIWQRKLRRDRARECIFRAFGGTNFVSFPLYASTIVVSFVFSIYVLVCQKTPDMSLPVAAFDVVKTFHLFSLSILVCWCFQTKYSRLKQFSYDIVTFRWHN